MRKQMADGYPGNPIVFAVNARELRNIFYDGIIERKFFTVAQLHDGDCGKRLGHGCPVKDGVRIYRLMSGFVSQAHRMSLDNAAFVKQQVSCANNSILMDDVVKCVPEGLLLRD